MSAPPGSEQHKYDEAHNSLINALSRLELAIAASTEAMTQRVSLGSPMLSRLEQSALDDLDAATDALIFAKEEWDRVNGLPEWGTIIRTPHRTFP